ncbi:MAG: nucleotidyltransferase domain-containing protein [Mariprofundaceae bacterium]|nr:nucleotidyltransferase domain-containing protein [Mariprofundaceae bacterium]
MRLTEQQQQAICKAAKKHFGDDVHVVLFGSRVSDEKKGGDIDLYIETEMQETAKLVDAKLHFLVDLHLPLGEQKIDVVLNTGHVTNMPIHRIAKETGVSLL